MENKANQTQRTKKSGKVSERPETVYWSRLNHGEWQLYIAATEKGLCYVGSPNKPKDEMVDWINTHIPGAAFIENEERLQPYAKELAEYLAGERKSFAAALDAKGTPFQVAVWHALCEIPYGQTQSYSDIANQMGRPAAVRAIGAAIGANPVLITVPCHRVIGKNGSLTGYRGGLDMKRELLGLEKERSSSEGSAALHA